MVRIPLKHEGQIKIFKINKELYTQYENQDRGTLAETFLELMKTRPEDVILHSIVWD